MTEDLFDFIEVEEGDLGASGFWEVDEGGVERVDIPLG